MRPLNLGCGKNPPDGFVNVDLAPLLGVDVVADLSRSWPFADACTRYMVASHVFEHLEDPVLFMREAWRVLAPGGHLDVRVPHWRHPNAYTDPTHRRFCTEATFDYWVAGQGLHEGYGAAYGSPPACFAYALRRLNGRDRAELQVVLRKLEQP